jgi:hypothetical protein
MTTMHNLRLLLQGYLHADWLDEYGDPWKAVEDFARSEPQAGRELLREIDALLGEDRSESELRHLIGVELGSGYLPDADGWAYADWLKEVRDRISLTST